MAILADLLPALGLIVGGLLLLRWWSQRLGGRRDRNLRVTARASLSRTASVAVVEIDGRRYLVGGSDANVSLLTELPRDEAADASAPQADPTGGVPADPSAAPAAIQELEGFELELAGPRNGLLDRLRARTARTALERPPRASHPLALLRR